MTQPVQERPPFEKILIANRGEIAVRIIRACHTMGIRTVAVYSDADRTALHVRFAHEAVCIGPPPSTESYLDIGRILDAAHQTGAQAIHPGYGFLAENPRFSRACRDAGIVFIGPPPEAMEAVGDKVRARALMTESGVPVVPGTPPLSADPVVVAPLAERIGYPVLLKAAAGGGGRGMRVVRRAEDLASCLNQARGEAASAFGDDRIFLEKLVERPRHIEVQVLADAHGGCIHLGERECSIQRRHQKLIEESPSPVVDAATREKIGGLAVAAVRAAGYVNAGTVEFLRAADGSFYFMEVNARLQVEHPVTEEVTGIDMVKAMIHIAAGSPLSMAAAGALASRSKTTSTTQERVELRGHAVECRIVAEDPSHGFMPAPGTIRAQRAPGGPGIRYDHGTYDGYTVPLFYDALIGKLVAWGHDRGEAIARMAQALDELRIDGITTSVSFHRKVMNHPAFRGGDLDTGFLERFPELLVPGDDPWLHEIAVVAAAVAHFRRFELDAPRDPGATRAVSAWRRQGARSWRG